MKNTIELPLTFESFIQQIPISIQTQVLQSLPDPINHPFTEETVITYRRRFVLLVISAFSTEIGIELWWQGNKLYLQMKEEQHNG